MNKVTYREAIDVCEDWFAHIERQKLRAKKMSEASQLAKINPESARKMVAAIDRAPIVFGGERLEAAVRGLLQTAKFMEKEVTRLSDVETRLKKADHQATMYAVEASNLRREIRELREEIAYLRGRNTNVQND